MKKTIKTGITKKKARFNLIKNGEGISNSILNGFPQIILDGNSSVTIEGSASIVEYDTSVVKIAFKSGFITFFGEDFILNTFSDNRISFCGKINSFEFS